MKYRPEIDGLRTIAVLPVILFHAGFGFASGGYVGVDVFFVISGYLITTILLNDLAHGQFSLLRFYERRARRILPALFVVMAVSFALGWVWMVQSQFLDLAEAMAATTLFISNILYWTQAGYFAAAAEENPLLHTWSLAVEEQYYLLFPPLLAVLMWMGRRAALAGTLLAALASLAAALFVEEDQSAKFFLTQYRIWELLAGSLCAFALAQRSGPWRNELLAGLGLLLVLGSIVLVDGGTPFPHFALAPVLGTVLIVLYAAPGTWVARLLSIRVMVGIGLISFSAYLWHQPLFAFARIRSIFAPDPWLMAGLAVLSLMLAWATWALIEQPFRGRAPRLLPKRWHVFTASLIGMCALLGATLYVGETDGAPGRGVVSELVPPLMDARAERFRTWEVLQGHTPARFDLGQFDPDGPETRLLILGDSHSKGIFNAIYTNPEIYADVQVRWIGLGFSCGTETDEVEVVTVCLADRLAARPDLFADATHVLLAARWLRQPKLDALPGYVETLATLDAQVLIAGPTQEFTFDAPDMMLQVIHDTGYAGSGPFPRDAAAKMFFEQRSDGFDALSAAVARIAERANVAFLDRRALVCDTEAERCTAVTPNMQATIYDYGHWTIAGARYFGQRMQEQDWFGFGRDQNSEAREP